MRHEIGRQTGGPEHSNALSLKYRVSNSMLARLPPGGTFDDGLLDIKITPFNHTICLRVVGGDTDVLDLVPVSKNI